MNAPLDAALRAALTAAVGAQHVLTEAGDVEPFVVDWRKRYRGAALCVVRPGTTDEVAKVVRTCAAAGIAIVPQGGNTGLCGASVPTGKRAEIVLSLARLNRIRELDPLNDTMTVEAGCVLADIQQAAAQADRLFPVSLGAEGSCQIGGNLSTNAGGVNVLHYGNTREQILGLEVVLPDGRIWKGLRGLRKDNTGYDLKQLFIGAEGTLGVITAAVLKLHPRPRATQTAWIATPSPRRAIEMLSALRSQLGGRLTAFELMPRGCVDAVVARIPGSIDPMPDDSPWYLLAEFSDSDALAHLRSRVEEALSDCLEQGFASDIVIAQSDAQAAGIWRLRERIPEAQLPNVKHDISVPVSRIPEMIERGSVALERAFPGVLVLAFGHIGDGNLHYNVGMTDATANEAFLQRQSEVNAVVYEIVDALGGSISAEHGIGQLKREQIRDRKPAIELELMRRLKDALDPQGVMNPGKVL